jgi:hypothetical protein
MASLIEWAEPHKKSFMVNTWERLRAGEPWQDWSGNTTQV